MASSKNKNQITISSVNKLKAVLNAESVQQQFKNALQENTGAFVASIIDLYSSDTYLQKCDPNQVVMEALKAATLKLPINKQLGFAWIVPYKKNNVPIPQFQIGYKGYIQLAMRTGQYRYINAGIIQEGVGVNRDILTGRIEFSGEPTSDKPQGYFAYMELLNGFSKTVYMTKDEVLAHAKRYSPSFKSNSSAWKTNFDEMAQKTVIRKLLSHYGFLSTEMMTALTNDGDFNEESGVAEEIEANANSETIDIEAEVQEEESAEEFKLEPKKEEKEGPGF
ncbi:MAG: recombinase RecT [Deltaproteobacteria bacterium]|nr:recombinase RecT [Deltaproteobacteria bacterium]